MSDATRYATDVDPAGHDSHALVVRAIRDGESVLELGCATGSTTKVLRDKGCTVTAVEVDLAAAARAAAFASALVVADLDGPALDAIGGTYDVVVVADVLEHLLDPGRVLDFAATRLTPGGRLVASLPNVAHAAVRLALLTGAFRYDDFGLLDRTHVRFFTHESVRALFADRGWTIASVERVVAGVDDALVPFDRSALPPGIEEWVLAQPEATTFQFVVVATPPPTMPNTEPAPPPTDALLATQGAALVAAEAEAARLRGEVEALRSAYDYDTAALRDTVAERDQTIEDIERSRAYRFMVRARELRRKAHR
jgi:2-polyprenyl-3-methyl-5-hydroxy-6-metoxy-1,4-benzoquinol methylase